MSTPSPRLALGPLLGLEHPLTYTVLFVTNTPVTVAEVRINQGVASATPIATEHGHQVWRAEWPVQQSQQATALDYSVWLDGVQAQGVDRQQQWSVECPGLQDNPRMVYASCNGFSDPTLMKNVALPFGLWSTLKTRQDTQAFHLLLMGGDQVYADSVWANQPALRNWGSKNRADQVKVKLSASELNAVDKAFLQLYLERWSQPDTANLLARIPQIMMWDDHDIIDGWGSYSPEFQQCPVMQQVFSVAAKYFDLFQLRGKGHNTNLIAPGSPHRSLSLTLNGTTILALDHRTERTLDQIMSPGHWGDFIAKLDSCAVGDLLVLSAVPVVYRDFAAAESVLDLTPSNEELTDDLKDHWRAKKHQGERARFIMRLLNNARARHGRTVILSGDVHVGCLGVIRDNSAGQVVNVHQVVSSGIVHPAPNPFQWAGILAITNDRQETLDENGQVCARMLTPFGSDTYLRTRNFATLEQGNDGKLWVNWVCENGDQPHYPLS